MANEPETGPLPVQQPPIRPVPRDEANRPPQQPIVVPPSPMAPMAPPTGGPDPEQLRQFEQYRQFQQFQEFQRYAQTEEGQRAIASGSAVGFPYPQQRRRPPWKRFLRSRMFRRLVTLLIVILVLVWGYNHYFGTTEDNDPQGAAGPGSVQEPGRLSPTPRQAVIALYKMVAEGGATEACTLVFDQPGGAAFARDFGAPTCAAAVTTLSRQVTAEGRDTYAAPKISDDAIVAAGPTATVSSCTLHVRGGPSLGKLLLSENGGGWVISGHQQETCPTTSAPTTTG